MGKQLITEAKTRRGNRIYRNSFRHKGTLGYSEDFTFAVKKDGERHRLNLGKDVEKAKKLADQISAFLTIPSHTFTALFEHEDFRNLKKPRSYKQRLRTNYLALPNDPGAGKHVPLIGEVIRRYEANAVQLSAASVYNTVNSLRHLTAAVIGLPLMAKASTQKQRVRWRQKIDAVPLTALTLGLYTCVPPHPDYKVIGPGVIFCFRLEGQRGGDADPKPVPSEAINPLHPYFLVYVLDDGNVRFGFAHPKQILDIYRILCSGKAEAYGQLCNLFDQQTNHGCNMTAYDTLLQKAVDSLAATFRKRAASGLQSGRGFVLPNAHEQVHEKTDLELVTWLVIQAP